MSTSMSATDLRNLADALDQLATTARETGVQVGGYSGQYITANDHELRCEWVATGDSDAEPGHYLVEIPDGT
ncbi:hypothetical protein [Streptomyces sp. OR43]|uniref:hypothetical protein n=1 Tax=Streptomyces sp. or43 TaxID=2478957 RepID=UPI0011CE22DD|nr:hypothetical protein [Streptomyces sp. or43]TXS35730.1 hypothetical protein EAO72_19115 [Streptomyces sp. or43]